MSESTTALVRTKRFVGCPDGCDHEWQIEHLFGRGDTTVTWNCDDCGKAWRIAVKGEVVEIAHSPKQDEGERIAVILEIPPQSEPIRFKLIKRQYSPGDWDAERERYLYEEHTCPGNWLGGVDVYLGDEPDPHGLARFVEARSLTAEEEAELEHGIGPVALNGAPGCNLERAREEATRRPN
jgi:hypothetical protein